MVDVTGWFTDASAAADGSGRYHGVSPARAVDSRYGTGGLSKPVAAGQSVAVTLAGTAGVPAMNASVVPAAVIANVTVTDDTGAGYLTIYPSGTPLPLASDLNYRAMINRANHAVAKLGSDGKVMVYSGLANTDIIIDVLGWFN